MNIGRRDLFKSATAILAGSSVAESRQSRAGTSGSSRLVLSEANAVCETTHGKVRGYTEAGIHTFKGIPYAAPPVGALRFLPPEKPPHWVNVRNALRYGPACPQPTGRFGDIFQFFFEYTERGYVDENCLYLNVWTPALNDNRKRPVMVWLHGGGFVFGSSFEYPSYDGRNLADRGDVVIVSINHRLNAFGFLHLASLGRRYADSVNVGMLDIVAALEWVRDNIVMFGGDPGNVTVFGQSGGGAKVNFLMAMPSARGLFHKAIVQSATPMTTNRRSIEFSEEHTDKLLTALALPERTIDALQKVPADALHRAYFSTAFRVEFERDARGRWPVMSEADLRDLPYEARDEEANARALVNLLVNRHGYRPEVAAAEVARFTSRVLSDNTGPVADGRVIASAPFNPSAPEMAADVPLLIGHTLNEGLGPTFDNVREQWSDADLRAELAKLPEPVPSQVVDALRAAYPRARPVEIYAHATSGLRYRIDTVAAASMKAAQNAAVYAYIFAWHTPVLDGRPRAFHRSELPFVFDNTDRCAHQTGGTSEARELAGRVSDAWIAFARSGNPNHAGLPDWPRFDTTRVATMFFDNTCHVRYDHDRVARDAMTL